MGPHERVHFNVTRLRKKKIVLKPACLGWLLAFTVMLCVKMGPEGTQAVILNCGWT